MTLLTAPWIIPVIVTIHVDLSNARVGQEAADRNRWIALYVLCVGMLMIVLDATIVNVALPSIQGDLGFSQSSLAWVVNGYLIAFGGLLLLSGRLGDLIGRRRIFLIGLTIFTAASLLCGLAQSQEVLVAARFIQGAGGAMTSAVILGIIVTMFPEPREQARAIGVYSFVASAGGSIGLLAGGVSPTRSTGTGSSSSTFRSRPPPGSSPSACLSATRASAWRRARTSSAPASWSRG